jgi:T5SS/PEP-CTERM-associated repeat protein
MLSNCLRSGACSLALLALAPVAEAVTLVWDGGGPNANWSALDDKPGPNFGRTNWSGKNLLPNVGDDFVFDGGNRLNNSNDIAALGSIGSLTFAAGAGAFTLGGTGFALTGSLDNLSKARQTLNLPITVGASGTSWDGGSGGVAITGAFALGNQALTLSQKITIQDLSQPFVIGHSGTASLTLASGSRVLSGSATVGENSGTGTLLVTGADSRFDVGGGQIFIGNHHGTGSAQVLDSGAIVAGDINLGDDGGSGSLRVADTGSSVAYQDLTIGNNGPGRLEIGAGGVVSGRAGIVGWGKPGSAQVSGAGAAWTVSNFLTIGGIQSGTLAIDQAGSVTAGWAFLGGGYPNPSSLSVSGAGSNLRLVGLQGLAGNLAIYGGSAMNIDGGAQASMDGATLDGVAGAGGVAAVTVRGDGSAWRTGGDVVLSGPSTIQVLAGGLMSAGGLSIGDGGSVTLDGGTLSLGTIATWGSGQLVWTSGTLAFDEARLGDFLPGVMVLSPGHTLQSKNGLQVGTGNLLLLAGGQFAGQLALAGGSVVALAGAVPMDAITGIRGHGSVVGAVVGGPTTTITADGGLSLGDITAANGFAFDGRLGVGGGQVVLLSAGPATPGEQVLLGQGGQLVAANGLLLSAGRSLSFTGQSSVLGAFVNDGLVAGTAGTLSFLNDVSGSGDFIGDIVFRAGFSPGHGAARVDFGQGDASFDTHAMLTLELFGSGHDELAGIDLLTFNGRLQLVFGDGFDPAAGTRFALLDFGSFAGALGSDSIEVQGFDRRRLDFSRLAIDGSLLVTAVPEPATWALWAAGLVLLFRRRPACAAAPARR